MQSVQIHERRVLLLDEWQADETLFLIHRGYRAENIYTVNYKVGTAARITLTLRGHGIRDVNVKSGDVGDAWTEFAKNGVRFHAVHLDFCQNVSPLLVQTLEAFNGMSAIGSTAIAVNMQVGREDNAVYRNAIDTASRIGLDNNEGRLLAAAASLTSCGWNIGDVVCRQHLCFGGSRSYISSSGHRMLWFFGELRGHCVAWADARHRDDLFCLARRRSTATNAPAGWWKIPICMKALSIGGKLTLREVMETLRRTAENADYVGEAAIRVGYDGRQLLQEIMTRKLNDPAFGAKLTKFADREKHDPNRQVPERYRQTFGEY